MALDNSILVELPEHGVAYKKVSGKTYVYYVTATYHRAADQNAAGAVGTAAGGTADGGVCIG